MNERVVIGYLYSEPESVEDPEETTRADVIEARRRARKAYWQSMTAKHQLMTAKLHAHAIPRKLIATEGEVRRQWEEGQAPGQTPDALATKEARTTIGWIR